MKIHPLTRGLLLSTMILAPLCAQTSVHKTYIETVGIGNASPQITNSTQRLATARDAALVQAQAEMLSALQGLLPTGGKTDEKTVKAGMLKAAEVIKTQWAQDGQCQVTLRLDKKKYEELTGIRLGND